MESKDGYKIPPYGFFVSAFIVANSLILMPIYSKSIVPFFLAAIIGVPATALIYKPLKYLVAAKNKIIRYLIYVIFAAALLVAAYFAAREYTGFIYEGVLTHENMFLIKLIFAFCVFFLAGCESVAIYKFSVLSALFVGTVFVILFLISTKTFDLKNLKSAIDFSNISIKQTADYFIRMFLPLLVAVLFIAEYNGTENTIRRWVVYGASAGVVLSLVVIFDGILSFGLSLAAKLPYPYIDNISTVTVGSLFTRMDGFAYFSFFACYILKCGVALKLAVNFVCRMGFKNKRLITMLFSALLLI